MRYLGTEVTYNEVPGEFTLAVWITGCKHHCLGCHSPELWTNQGEEMNWKNLSKDIKKHAKLGVPITTILFMGGDQDTDTIEELAKRCQNTGYKIAWYVGAEDVRQSAWCLFDYIKVGRYDAEKGPLTSRTTNQRLYQIERASGRITDITYKFWNEDENLSNTSE